VLANPFTTANAKIEFWADPGAYDLLIEDTQAPARFAPKEIGWDSLPATVGGIPTVLLAEDAGITLQMISQAIQRQHHQIGEVIDWWRPSSGVPAPSGFEFCDGRTIPDADHDFPVAGSIVLPDLRNAFILGADSAKADGAAAGGQDAVTNAPGIGGAGGSQRHTLAASELAPHDHPITGFSAVGSGQTSYYTIAASRNDSTGVTLTDGSGSAIQQNTGSGNSHNNMPKYVGLLKLMKVRWV
jgi:microcystin-dependent protein